MYSCRFFNGRGAILFVILLRVILINMLDRKLWQMFLGRVCYYLSSVALETLYCLMFMADLIDIYALFPENVSFLECFLRSHIYFIRCIVITLRKSQEIIFVGYFWKITNTCERYFWDVLKTSQKRHLFWDVFETS